MASRRPTEDTFTFRGRVYPKDYLSQKENVEIWKATDSMYHCDMLYMGDSIIKYTAGIANTQVVSYCGVTVAQLGARIYADKVPYINDKKLILVHVGTNNVEYNTSAQILDQMQFLISTLRHKVPEVKIAMGHILHRTKDYLQTEETISNVNNSLEMLKDEWNIQTLPVIKKFTYYCAPVDYYYAVDGIHLNREGVTEWTTYIKKMMGQLRTKAEIPRLATIYPPTAIWRKIKL
jgi:hypothetical protein